MIAWTPFAIPLVGAIVSLFLRSPVAQRWVARGTALALLATSLYLLALTDRGVVPRVDFGGWAPPMGIGFEIDRLSSLFLALLAIVLVASLWGLTERASSARARRLLPTVLFLTAALAGAFSTADLFNLFVMFELVLVSSYRLLQNSGRSAARTLPAYVAVNVVASVLFFAGAGMAYAVGGSLSVPHLAVAFGEVSVGWRTAVGGLLVLAFGTKAGLVPFMFWLPRTYPHLYGPIAALFAGMMTKLGVYALLRVTPLLAGTVLPDLLVFGGSLAAVAGVFAAQAQTRFRDLLCFHIVSQVGFMVAGLGLGTVAGVAGATLYVAHHVLVKSALFLIADETDPVNDTRMVESRSTSTKPWAEIGFVFAGLSLAGLPPLSGFLGKIAVFRALVESSRPFTIGFLLLASLFTLVSVMKIWWLGFRGERVNVGQRLPSGAAILVVASVLLVLFGGPAYQFAAACAEQIVGTPDVVASGVGR